MDKGKQIPTNDFENIMNDPSIDALFDNKFTIGDEYFPSSCWMYDFGKIFALLVVNV